MNIHHGILAHVPQFAELGYSVHPYGGTPDRSPSKSVTFAKSVVLDPGHQPAIAYTASLHVWLDDAGKLMVKPEMILQNMVTISSGEWSFPNANFPRNLEKLGLAAKAAAYEVAGFCDRGYFITMLQMVGDLLKEGRAQRAETIVGTALSCIETE